MIVSIPLLCCNLIIIIFFILLPSAAYLSLAYEDPRGTYCDDTTYYAPNSTFSSNLNISLKTLTTNTASTGYASGRFGDGNQTVTAVALCRGTINQSECQLCVEAAASGIRTVCPNQTVAQVWYTLCMLLYSDDDFLTKSDYSIRFSLFNVRIVPDLDDYDVKIRLLMRNLSSTAGASEKKYAVGRTSAPGNHTIYGYVDCNRDLDNESCNGCLLAATSYINTCCFGRWAGWICTPTCNIQYNLDPDDHDDWLNGPPYIETDTATITSSPPPALLALPPSTGAGGGGLTVKIAAITAGFVVLAAVALAVAMRIRKIEKVKKRGSGVVEEDSISDQETIGERIGSRNFMYDLDVLVAATDNFRLANRLGAGGFGTVYKVLFHIYPLAILDLKR